MSKTNPMIKKQFEAIMESLKPDDKLTMIYGEVLEADNIEQLVVAAYLLGRNEEGKSHRNKLTPFYD